MTDIKIDHPVTLASNADPAMFRVIAPDGVVLVNLNMTNGHVELSGDPNEAAQVFWQAVSRYAQPPDLIDLIRQAEWAGPTDGDGPSTCPWCRKPAHAPDCPVKPLLYPETT